MKAVQALQQAGLKPIKPSFGGAKTPTEMPGALLVADGRRRSNGSI